MFLTIWYKPYLIWSWHLVIIILSSYNLIIMQPCPLYSCWVSIWERKSSFIFDCDQKTFPCNVFWFRTVFAADKIFIGLFSSFRLGRKESQMEIVPDHLCHFQSKSLSAFLGNVRNQICFPGPRSPWLLLTPYLLLCSGLDIIRWQ